MGENNREWSNWNTFVSSQSKIIDERINRYSDTETIRTQIEETGDISDYQNYKISTVTPFLKEALNRIALGTYGICSVCGKEIPKKRLDLVPAALACVSCDESK